MAKKIPTDLDIVLDPHDGAARIAVQALDDELDYISKNDAPGAIFAQVFPRIQKGGKVLGVNLKTIVLDHEAGLKIQAILKAALK